MSDWTDMIVGDRMAVDREFNSRVEGSNFTNQEWGLIMTATTFEIEHPEDDERARIVADTSNLKEVLPQMDKVRKQAAPTRGPGGQQQKNGGVFGKLADALGLGSLGGGGGMSDEQKLEQAQQLVQEYARELQRHLENSGRWEEIREAAAED
ncbi:MAG: DUF5799 family protein [Haloarculaceae archaeon]